MKVTDAEKRQTETMLNTLRNLKEIDKSEISPKLKTITETKYGKGSMSALLNVYNHSVSLIKKNRTAIEAQLRRYLDVAQNLELNKNKKFLYNVINGALSKISVSLKSGRKNGELVTDTIGGMVKKLTAYYRRQDEDGINKYKNLYYPKVTQWLKKLGVLDKQYTFKEIGEKGFIGNLNNLNDRLKKELGTLGSKTKETKLKISSALGIISKSSENRNFKIFGQSNPFGTLQALEGYLRTDPGRVTPVLPEYRGKKITEMEKKLDVKIASAMEKILSVNFDKLSNYGGFVVSDNLIKKVNSILDAYNHSVEKLLSAIDNKEIDNIDKYIQLLAAEQESNEKMAEEMAEAKRNPLSKTECAAACLVARVLALKVTSVFLNQFVSNLLDLARANDGTVGQLEKLQTNEVYSPAVIALKILTSGIIVIRAALGDVGSIVQVGTFLAETSNILTNAQIIEQANAAGEKISDLMDNLKE